MHACDPSCVLRPALTHAVLPATLPGGRQERAAAEKKADGAALDVKASEFRDEERRKAEERRAHEAKIREDRDQQLALAEKARRDAAAKKQADEVRRAPRQLRCGALIPC